MKYYARPKSLVGTRRNANDSNDGFFSWLGLPRVGLSLTFIGVCLFTFSIVTYWLPLGDIGIAVAVVGLILQRNQFRFPAPVKWFSLFLVWAFAASYFSVFPGVARDSLIEYLKLLVILLVIVNALRTEGQVRLFLMFFLGCFILFPVRGTLIGGQLIDGRAVWNYIYNNANDLATLSLIALGIAVGLIFARPSKRIVTIGAAVSSLLLLYVIFITQSRGAFIGLIGGMGFGFLAVSLKHKAVLLISIIAIASLVYVVPSDVWDRLGSIEKLTSTETIAEADEEGSAAERFRILQTGWAIFADNPIVGVGLGGYQLANAIYDPNLGAKDAHNTYLHLAAETGAVGLLIWLCCFGSVLLLARRSVSEAPDAPLTIQLQWLSRAFYAYLIASFVGTYSKLTFPYLVLAVVWCASCVVMEQAKSSRVGDADTGD